LGWSRVNHDYDLIAQIFQHPGFEALTARVNATQEAKRQALVTLILRTREPVDQSKVDFERGVMAGVELFLTEAAKAGRAFARNKDGETV
jgi:hypothetical protein